MRGPLGAGVLAVIPAWAADQSIGQTPAALAWIHILDSQGISMWNYELSLDRGGITNPGKFFWASMTDMWWGLYRFCVALALWFLDWVFSFTWVQTIAAPMTSTGAAMQQVVDRLGLVPTFLTITALVAGLWMLQGKYATTLWEVAVSCVIAALATGVFAYPVQLIAGPEGYIVKANQVGQELAVDLATGSSAPRDRQETLDLQIGQLVDTFIRQPTELTNFGRTIEGTACEDTYLNVVRAGPYGNDDDIRTAMGDCDEGLGEYASNPSASMALSSLAFLPAAAVILLLAVVLAGSLIVSTVWAMYQSVKLIVALVTGLLPGGSRGSLMLTLAETVMALASIVFTSVFLSVFLMVVSYFFAQADSGPQTFVVVDILILAGIIVYWRQRQQFRAAARRLAEWMSQRPGAGATRLPDRPRLTLSSAASGVRTIAAMTQMRQHRTGAHPGMGPVFIDNRAQAAMFFGMGYGTGDNDENGPYPVPVTPRSVSPGPRRLQLTAGPDHGPGPEGPHSPEGGPSSPPGSGGPPPSGGRMSSRISAVRRGAGTLLRAGAGAALAAASAGVAPSIAVVSRAPKAAMTARRAALVARLNSTKRSGPTRRNPQAPPRAKTPPPTAKTTSPPPRTQTTGVPWSGQSPPRARPQVIRGEVISPSQSRSAPSPARTPKSTAPKTTRPAKPAQAAQIAPVGAPGVPRPVPPSTTRPSRAAAQVPRSTPQPRGTGQVKPAVQPSPSPAKPSPSPAKPTPSQTTPGRQPGTGRQPGPGQPASGSGTPNRRSPRPARRPPRPQGPG